MVKKIKVLIAKPGLDGHEAGARLIARVLCDAGMEVVYSGMRQTPQMVAETAIQEDVDVVGLSILSGAHLELFPPVIEGLKKKGKGDTLVVAGGIIPDDDIPALEKIGIKVIFGPGTSTDKIVDFIKQEIATRKKTGMN